MYFMCSSSLILLCAFLGHKSGHNQCISLTQRMFIVIVALVTRIRPPGRAGVVTKNVLYTVPPPFSMSGRQ